MGDETDVPEVRGSQAGSVPASGPAAEGPWRLSGWALVKSTGFAYELLEDLRVPEPADRHAGGKAAVAGGSADADPIAECVRRLLRTCADPRFLEAVLLSSRGAYERLHHWLRTDPDPSRLRSADRRRVLLAAMYLQRMCAKNESTSFFGPVAWARVHPDEPFRLDLGEPAPVRLATAWTHWAAQAIADVMSADPDVLAEVAPRVPPNLVERDGRQFAVRYDRWPITLDERVEPPRTPAERALVARCDGRTTAAELAAAEGLDLDGTLDLLRALDRRGSVRFGLTVPVGLIDPLHPLIEFAARLSGPAGRRWRGVLAELDLCRQRFHEAPSLAARREALSAVGRTFTEVTGAAADKDAGRHYADRSILVEDGRFPWPRFDLGRPLHRYLTDEAPVLLDLLFELSLARRRRLVAEITEWFADTFRGQSVPLDRVLAAADAAGLGERLRKIDDRTRMDGPSALSDRLRANADRPRVRLDMDWAKRAAAEVDFDTWCVAGADLFVAAPDEAAINADAFTVVVGEVHGLHDQLLQGLWPALHPDRAGFEAEIGGLIEGLADARICDPVLAHGRKTLARAEVLPEVEFLGTSPRPPGRVGRAADLRVRLDGGELVLECPTLGRVLLTRPPLPSWGDEVESIFTPFTGARLIGAEDMLRALDDVPHLPRLTVGRTVVHRETWRIPAPPPRSWSGLHPANRTRMRRLRDRYGFPDQVYVRFAGEPKPIFVDFGVPVLADLFSRHYDRAHGPIVVSEMLPGPADLWLRDHAGRHTAELRFGYYRARAGAGAQAGERSG
ncbi:lantibiotic dehydratase [Embleya sp. NPDC020630]|uniref:lantibiotic dehydratase n=1 Tax=Embleya sp. NPDC020630 TaxID=3363979 RepID=UPI00379A937F